MSDLIKETLGLKCRKVGKKSRTKKPTSSWWDSNPLTLIDWLHLPLAIATILQSYRYNVRKLSFANFLQASEFYCIVPDATTQLLEVDSVTVATSSAAPGVGSFESLSLV